VNNIVIIQMMHILSELNLTLKSKSIYMKKQLFRGRIALCLKSLTAIALFATLPSLRSNAQTYYSIFADPTGKYGVINPTGAVCAYPLIANANLAADNSGTNYASVGGLIGLGVICTSTDYGMRAKIAFPSGITEAPAGNYAGFAIGVNRVLGVTLLSNNIEVTTYLNNNPQETATGSSLLGLTLLSGTLNSAVPVGFKTTKAFDEVGIRLSNSLITLTAAFENRFYWAYASATATLPVKLASFDAKAEGKNVRLSWTSASEHNVSRFDIEKTSDYQQGFVKVGTLEAKGNSTSQTNYTYSDPVSGAGSFSYRLKMIDKDGSVEYSKLATVKINSGNSWKVYPTVLSTGRDITVETKAAVATRSEIQIVNHQGQVMQSVTTTGARATLSTGKLTSGLYIVNCYQNGQLQTSEKIVIK
jgi:hypothetical protein